MHYQNRLSGFALCCLIIIISIVQLSCRKDRGLIPEHASQVIDEQLLYDWLKENPLSQVLSPDWKKAKQATFQGKSIVRIPILNIDKQSKTPLKQALNTKNFNPARPPEIFFIKNHQGKIEGYLINSIPKGVYDNNSASKSFSGSLVEWNMKGDTLHTIEIENNKIITDKIAAPVAYSIDQSYQETLKSRKLAVTESSGGGNNGNGGFWSFLGRVLGAIGNFLGLPTSNTYADGYRIDWGEITRNIKSWFDSEEEIYTGGGDSGGGYIAAGGPIYSSYIASDLNTGGTSGTNITPIIFNEYTIYKGGPSEPPTPPNEDGIYVMEYLNLSPDAQDYILTYPAIPLTKTLRDYLNVYGWTQENRDFVSWAVEYSTINPTAFDSFNQDVFVGPDQSFIDSDANETTASLNLSNSGNATFNSNGFDIFIPDVNLPDYGPNHPVSQAIMNFNPWIYYAFVGANNTSLAHFHLTAKGQNLGDGYRKALGAIGEGLFVSRLTAIPTSPPANLFVAKMLGKTHIDALVVRNVPFVGGTGYEIAINYTDINGNYLQKRMHHPDGLTIGPIKETTIAYEVKTLNAQANTPESLYRMFKEGVKQVIHRANIPYMSAAVLVFDDKAWNKLRNSPYGSQAIDDIISMSSIKNDDGEQKIYFRIEKGLTQDANRAFFGLKDRIKNL